MKVSTKQEYQCELCGTKYSSEATAKECESRPVRFDGVKVGDYVRILRGDGKGKRVKVSSVFVFDREWGHYAWKRYWHTVGCVADMDCGSRQLTFDDYEIVGE